MDFSFITIDTQWTHDVETIVYSTSKSSRDVDDCIINVGTTSPFRRRFADVESTLIKLSGPTAHMKDTMFAVILPLFVLRIHIKCFRPLVS